MPAKPGRTIRVSDEDWAEIGRRAEKAGETVTGYLLRRALEPDKVGPLLKVLRKLEALAREAVERHRPGSS